MRYFATLFTILFTIMSLLILPQAAKAQSFLDMVPDPPCETTTCMSIESIALAKHVEVEFDPVPSYIDQLHIEFPCATLLSDLTGVTVIEQVPGSVERFGDSFCTMQGCTGHSARTERIGTTEEIRPIECLN